LAIYWGIGEQGGKSAPSGEMLGGEAVLRITITIVRGGIFSKKLLLRNADSWSGYMSMICVIEGLKKMATVA